MTAEQILDIATRNASGKDKATLADLRAETLDEINRILIDKDNRWVRLLGLEGGFGAQAAVQIGHNALARTRQRAVFCT